MKKTFFILILLTTNNLFSQKVNIEKETLETLDWINSKLIEYQFETEDTKQVCTFIKVEKLNNGYYLVGEREQITSKPWASVLHFKIPISKINNITFVEKTSNYWVEIKLKNNEKAIINSSEEQWYDNVEKIEFMLNKQIDNENLKPRLLKAFNHLLELYGNVKNEKF
ncbi:hypothetical protein K5L04_06805 [Flavobacterium psychrophilum]|uniref:hypothetical protein n=1 Tax=Flavobacterium psychrophilum TaxID=96345 RepID=UPI001C8F998D|nr:hypothetical protein [Flavobacterium psychrophilum]QZK99441.1 hypothetical protein K5L04_06805 [Flavobacterium psychrophilum]